ncbi:MAG: hypothetical protein GY842_08390 [bacterium]|nr:hypothetical protein [bacterium]
MDRETQALDQFLYRLLGGIAAGMSLILLAFATHWTYVRAPRAATVLTDFGTPLPPSTTFVLGVPWLTCAVAALALLAGVASVVMLRRWLLAGAWILVLLSFGATAWVQYAVDLPLWELVESVGG